ncbi:hypothetical protein CEN49_11085 [Fischerella thermalis CCMEE 5273]|nr:hypothetical protein CEN49_11085 [Fischerella thermalis CCMEE 5273]
MIGRWGDGGLGVPTLWGWGVMGSVRSNNTLYIVFLVLFVPFLFPISDPLSPSMLCPNPSR